MRRAGGRISFTFKTLQRLALLYGLVKDFPLLPNALQRLARFYETGWWKTSFTS
jgi:hypothetical protein